MRLTLISLGVIVALSAVVFQSAHSRSEPAEQAPPAGKPGPDEAGGTRPAADRSADEAAIRANIAQFVKAYNAGDAKAVAALFTPDGQAVDKDGNAAEGRAAIAQTFAGLFKET